MSSSELLEQIRLSRPAAPAELRQHIRGLEIEERPLRVAALTGLRVRPRRLLVALPAAALVAIAAAGAIGIARSGHGDTRTAAGGGAALTQPFAQESAPPTGDSAATSSRAGKAAPAPAPAPNLGRLQRYEASLRLRVENADDLSDATQRALRLTQQLGGFVVSLQTNVPEQGTSGATLVVRVPRERVQQAIVGFSQLGTILSQQVNVEDLQQQVDAMTDRIAVLTAEIARIERQLKNPNLPLETRARLSAKLAADRRERRELVAGRQQTTREGELATVSLALTTQERSEVAPAPTRIDRALDRAGEVLAWEAAAVLLVLVAVGPLLVLGVLLWLAAKLVRRRADERLLERA
jgi:uncharacterized protein DUF4349